MDPSKTTDRALLLLRTAGLLLAFLHGWGKVAALAAGNGDRVVGMIDALGFPLPGLFAWAAGLAELVGGLLVFLGLYTRAAAGFAAFTMFVAAFVRHRALTQLAAWVGLISPSADELRSLGDPERALLFLVVMVAIGLLGPGRISLDHRLSDRRR